MKKKRFSIQSKVLDDVNRIIRFVASTEAVDRDNDTISVAGWQLENYLKNPVFLPFHDWMKEPIGKAVNVIKDTTEKKLIMDIKFPTIEELSSDPSNPSDHAKYCDTMYNMYANGYMSAVSVGFDPTVAEPNGKGGYAFLEQELLELSAVSIPANQEAVSILRSKGFTGKEMTELVDNLAHEIDSDEITFDDDSEEVTKSTEKNDEVNVTEKVKNLLNQGNLTLEELSEGVKALESIASKTADINGNPDMRDIERALDEYLRSTLGYDAWTCNFYPIGYPNEGYCTVRYYGRGGDLESTKYHKYAFAKDASGNVTTSFDEGIVVEMQMTAKQKALIQQKAGAELSRKNINNLVSIQESLDAAKGVIDTMLQASTSAESTAAAGDEDDDDSIEIIFD